MHQVVTAQLAARRAGTQSTKTRAEVSGGGKKPFKQKGTGNARQGSTRAPHFSGGGVALGPKPRKYDQKTPKKMIKLALRSALSDRAAEGKVVVVDEWGFDPPRPRTPRPRSARSASRARRSSSSTSRRHQRVRSFLNLPEVQLIEVNELNAYDILCNDYVVFSQATLPTSAPPPSAPKKAAAGQRRCPEGPYGAGSAHGFRHPTSMPQRQPPTVPLFEIKGNADSMSVPRARRPLLQPHGRRVHGSPPPKQPRPLASVAGPQPADRR
jgi:large subunit ribosomal protein L4